MKRKLHPFLLTSIMLLMLAPTLFTACGDDDEKPKALPEVATAAVTGITPTTALGGGSITSDGNAAITASGLVYSSTNATPTTADEKTTLTATSGSFTSELTNLTSGTQYYVRAYATNSVGTGYGNTVKFATGNAAPAATRVTIAGTVQVPETLTASYTYSDAENDAESGTTIQWYIASDGTGTGETAIEDATELTYTLQPADEFKFIRVGVTPKAATGATVGTEVKSAFSGPVAEEPSTITSMYNGQEVTYGIIVSSTGRRWLDRNLGAPNAPTAFNDWANYGDLFQWGRGADGHQLTNRAATNGGHTSVNGTSSELSISDSPGHPYFILVTGTTDWRTPKNDNLWQGVDGINSPCPRGWRIPTKDEWLQEEIANRDDGFKKLKLTLGGSRTVLGTYLTTTSLGNYWSSSISDEGAQTLAVRFTLGSSSFTNSFGDRAMGMMCRCIKN